MNKAMYSLYEELLKEANESRLPISVLSRFHKKMESARQGREDISRVIIPLIREIEKYARRGNKESVLSSMARKRNRFSELQRQENYERR